MSAVSQAPPRSLTGSLGAGSIVFMVVAAAAPLTAVAGAVPIGIALGNGAAFPVTFLMCCAVLLVFSVGFAAMSRHVADAGAFWAYVQRGLGRPLGRGAAYLALAAYTSVQLAVYGLFGATTAGLVAGFGGPALPWWGWAAVAWAAVAWLGYRHIDLSSKVLGVLLVAEVGIVLAFDVVVAVTGGAEGPSTALFEPAQIGSGSLGAGITFAVASFIGFEATAVFRAEAREPDRTVPRATYAALILIGAFYAVSSWAVVTAWGDAAVLERSAAAPDTMVIDAMARYLGGVGGTLTAVLLVTSLFAALLSFHNVLARYGFSLGASGALPARFAGSHDRHGSPHRASLAQTASAAVVLAVFVLAGLDPVAEVFTWMSGAAVLGVLALMTLTCTAVIVFFRRNRIDARRWHTLLAPSLGLVGLAALMWLVLANFVLLTGGSTLVAGILLTVLAAAFAAGIAMAALERKQVRP